MYKRIVVKVGTKVITENGLLDEVSVETIVRQISELRGKNVEVILVTSGAVAAGKDTLQKNGNSAAERQVYAAVGQINLMNIYARLFKARGLACAQILVTKGDFRDREHYANMKTTFENLLKESVVPVVNENDAVAIHELGFSDNDELAALIAAQMNAEAVLFLSNVDGVLADGKVIEEVEEKGVMTLEKHVSHERSKEGRGGMKSKFALAKKLMGQGIAVYVANGKGGTTILDIADGKSVGTKFVPKGKLSAVKRRLAYAGGLAAGAVYVNQGAEEVLLSKTFKSLLPVGITKIEGTFKKGDTIEIRNESGKKIGSGVAQYDSKTAQNAIGKQGEKALIHYDYLFVG